jgi:dynamin 1-like protein
MVERAVEDSVVLVDTPLGTPRATSSSSLDTVSGSVSGGAGELLRRFPALRAAVVAAATGALDAHRRESERMVEALVDMEASYFDADFFRRFTREQQQQREADAEDEVVGKKSTANGSGKVLTLKPNSSSPTLVNDNGDAMDYSSDDHVQLIQRSVYAYVDAVRARIAKQVPKAVVHCQVARARSGLLTDFYLHLGGKSEEELLGLMAEDAGVGERREACKTRLGLLNRARAEIAAVVG